MDEQVPFNVFHALKHLSGGGSCFNIDVVDQLVKEIRVEDLGLNGYEQPVLSKDCSNNKR